MDAFALQAPLRQNPARSTPAGSISRSPAPEPALNAAGEDAAKGVCCALSISRGDRGAIERFYRSGLPIAMAVARHATGRDEAFCLDVVHDAMIRVLKGVKPTLSDAQLDVYLKRCVVTAALDRIRRDRRREARERAKPRDTWVATTEADLLPSLRRALEQLDELDRALLASRFVHESTLESTGRAHGLTGAAAHGRIRRALARLGALMKDGEE